MHLNFEKQLRHMKPKASIRNNRLCIETEGKNNFEPFKTFKANTSCCTSTLKKTTEAHET